MIGVWNEITCMLGNLARLSRTNIIQFAVQWAEYYCLRGNSDRVHSGGSFRCGYNVLLAF